MNLRGTPPSHDCVKPKMAADRMPGTATGKMMSVIAPKRVAPWALPFFTVSLLRHLRGRGPERRVEAMGLFRVTGRLTGPTGWSEDAELLVDTGVTLLVLPRSWAPSSSRASCWQWTLSRSA